jgi:putative FmdB family regulatory protein
MPEYDFRCDACGHEREITQSIHDPLPDPGKCPNCKKREWRQDFRRKSLILRDGDPKSVAQQAERNRKAMGEEQHQMKVDELLGPAGRAKRDAPAPWWRDKGSKPLDLSKVKNTQDYIMTGEKN